MKNLNKKNFKDCNRLIYLVDPKERVDQDLRASVQARGGIIDESNQNRIKKTAGYTYLDRDAETDLLVDSDVGVTSLDASTDAEYILPGALKEYEDTIKTLKLKTLKDASEQDLTLQEVFGTIQPNTTLTTLEVEDGPLKDRALEGFVKLQNVSINSLADDQTAGSLFGFKPYTEGLTSSVEQLAQAGELLYSLDYQIPNTLKSFNLTGTTEIPAYAFMNMTTLGTQVDLTGKTTIGTRAFYGCTGIQEITLSDELTTIGDYAFYGCTGLKSIIIPPTVTSIGDHAFDGCNSLETLIFSKTKTYSTRVLRQEQSLNQLTIGDYAFANTSILTCNLPENLISLGKGAFSDSELNHIDFGVSNSLSTFQEACFSGCANLVSIVLPQNLQKVSKNCFQGTDWLTVLYGPELNTTWSLDLETFSCEEGNDNFLNAARYYYDESFDITTASSLRPLWHYSDEKAQIYYSTDIVTLDEDSVYNETLLRVGINTTASTNVILPAIMEVSTHDTYTITMPVRNFYSSGLYSSLEIERLFIPESITTFEADTFPVNSKIEQTFIENVGKWCKTDFALTKYASTEIQIPNASNPLMCTSSLYIQGNKATLTNPVQIPAGTVELKNGIFYGCTCIPNLIIPNTVFTIGQHALQNCRGLEYLSFEKRKFDVWRNPETTDVGNTIELILPRGFLAACTKLKKLTIPFAGAYYPRDEQENSHLGHLFDTSSEDTPWGPDWGTSIKVEHFGSSILPKQLQNVTILHGPISKYSLSACTPITAVTLEDCFTVEDRAFADCTNLQKVQITENTTSIAVAAFEGCNSIQEMTLPFIGTGQYKHNTLTDRTKEEYMRHYFGAIFGYYKSETIIREGNANSDFSNTSPDSFDFAILSDRNWEGEYGQAIFDLYKFNIPSSLETLNFLSMGNGEIATLDYCTNEDLINLWTSACPISGGVLSGCAGLKNLTLPVLARRPASDGASWGFFGSLFNSTHGIGSSGNSSYIKVRQTESEGTITSPSSQSLSGTFCIPAQLTNVSFTAPNMLYISSRCFSGVNMPIKHLTLPNFRLLRTTALCRNNANLQDITITADESAIESVSQISIGFEAFMYCSNLRTIGFKIDNVSYSKVIEAQICDYAFQGCASLSSLANLACTEIGSQGFKDCRNLRSIRFAPNFTANYYTLGAFSGCIHLVEVINHSDSVTNEDLKDLLDTEILALIEVHSEESSRIYLTSNGDWWYYFYKDLENKYYLFTAEPGLNIPGMLLMLPDASELEYSGITEYQINKYAFYNAFDIWGDAGLIIPEIVTKIGEFAFATTYDLTQNDSLTHITGLDFKTKKCTLDTKAFYNLAKVQTISFEPEAEITFADQVFGSQDTVTYMNSYSLYGLNWIILPKTASLPTKGSICGYNRHYFRIFTYDTNIKDSVSYSRSIGFGAAGLFCFSESRPDPEPLAGIRGYWYMSGTKGPQVWAPEGTTDGLEYVNSDRDTDFSNVIGLGTAIAGDIVAPDYSPEGGLLCGVGAKAFKNTTITSFRVYNDNEDSLSYYYMHSIEEEAFSDCANLTEVRVPGGVESIKDYAFQNCPKLTVLKIPTSINSIASTAFNGSPNIQIYYSGSKEELSESLENSFKDFTVYYYSKSVPTLPGNFWHYNAQNQIRKWESVGELHYQSIDDESCIVAGLGEWSSSQTGTVLEVPEVNSAGKRVVGIAPQVFAGWDITSIILPDSIESIGYKAFYNCPNLQQIQFSATNLKYMGTDVFTDSPIFYMPDYVEWQHFNAGTNILGEFIENGQLRTYKKELEVPVEELYISYFKFGDKKVLLKAQQHQGNPGGIEHLSCIGDSIIDPECILIAEKAFYDFTICEIDQYSGDCIIHLENAIALNSICTDAFATRQKSAAVYGTLYVQFSDSLQFIAPRAFPAETIEIDENKRWYLYSSGGRAYPGWLLVNHDAHNASTDTTARYWLTEDSYAMTYNNMWWCHPHY